MTTNSSRVLTLLKPLPAVQHVPRLPVMGVGIDPVTLEEAVDRIEHFVRYRAARQVATVNLDYLRLASEHEEFREVLNAAHLALADGMPIVWGSRIAGRRLPERVTGQDLAELICSRAADYGWSVFFLGAAPGVAIRASEAMMARYAGLDVVGTYSPPIGPFSNEENEYICARIREAAPDVLFVALGAPRQDLWIYENMDRLGVPVSVGVGCTFDVMCGLRPRAPRWMQRAGLEWLHRLSREPSRLAGRYLQKDLPVFGRLLVHSLAQRASRTRDEVPS